MLFRRPLPGVQAHSFRANDTDGHWLGALKALGRQIGLESKKSTCILQHPFGRGRQTAAMLQLSLGKGKKLKCHALIFDAVFVKDTFLEAPREQTGSAMQRSTSAPPGF